MKLKDTLTKSQTIDLISGQVVGIFPSMILDTDKFYNKLYELCLGYYMYRSGEKTISTTYERIISLADNDTSPEHLIGSLIRGKFIDKWKRVYDVLLDTEYDAIHNKEFVEDKTGNNQNKNTYDSSIKKIGDDTDITIYDTNVEDNGKTGTHEVSTRSNKSYDDIYGFNSSTPVGDSTFDENEHNTVVGDADKNTNYNISIKTGTETKNMGVNQTEEHLGTDTRDIIIEEKIVNKGRDLPAQDLVNSELEMRNKQLFFDIIYNDIDSIATLQIYI